MPTVIEFEENIEKLVSRDFDRKTFFADFLTAVGAPPALLRQMEGQGTLFGDAPLLWRKKLHFLLAPMGRVQQCVNYLELHPDTKKHKPRILLSTDGEDVIARDTKSGELLTCAYRKLSDNFGFFLPLADIERYKIADENPVDVKATGRLAKFYDEILRDNSSWKTEEKRHALNHFITQIIFCLFAEDTGIFPEKGMFTQTISTYCENDSKAATEVIRNLFSAMATEEAKREGLPVYASKFPHVNGGLFKGQPDVPNFTKGSVRYLLDAGQLEWQYINPDIFGSMIQSIVNENQRAELGMHYTSVPNILKVLEPMFLDSLREQVSEGWNKPKALHAVLERLGKIRVFDPACGSGNFLVIAYRELREIEISVISRLNELENYSAPLWSHVKLENFFGIEYIDFAAETARLALWIAEYQMTTRYAAEFGQRPPALPLKDAGVIVHGNALRIKWDTVCPHASDKSVETYIVGNPPYIGSTWQTEEQKGDMKYVFDKHTKLYKSLDYVAGWFLKASQYARERKCWFSFVSTNSVCQGQQTSILWPLVFRDRMEIVYAHQSFSWSNNARNNAGITCVIVACGPTQFNQREKTLFTEAAAYKVPYINAYLTGGSDVIVEKRSSPIGHVPEMVRGSLPADGGHLILDRDEKDAIEQKHPSSAKFIKRFFGSQELVRGVERYCIWVDDKSCEEAYAIPEFRRRFELVAEMRRKSDKETTREQAGIPYRFAEVRHKEGKNTVVIPSITSHNRYYLPVGVINDGSIIQNKAFGIYDDQLWTLAVIGSRLHQNWIATVCVRMRMDYSYSNTLGWNTFPVRELAAFEKDALRESSERILIAREEYFDKTIAELYDQNFVKRDYPNLWRAHLDNDALVEGLLLDEVCGSDERRLQRLFEEYSKMLNNNPVGYDNK